VCTMKEVIKGKGKRSWKCKSTALEVDDLEIEEELEVARTMKEAINGRRKRGRKRKGAPEPEAYKPEVERVIEAPKP
jgi:hypothetical protein